MPVKVGLVLNTTRPLPVSSVIKLANTLEDTGENCDNEVFRYMPLRLFQEVIPSPILSNLTSTAYAGSPDAKIGLEEIKPELEPLRICIAENCLFGILIKIPCPVSKLLF